MKESFDLVTWIVGQTDRGLFILALVILVWVFTKQQKRNEVTIDRMHTESMEARQNNHERFSTITAQLFNNCQHVTEVTTKAISVMERLERKL